MFSNFAFVYNVNNFNKNYYFIYLTNLLVNKKHQDVIFIIFDTY